MCFHIVLDEECHTIKGTDVVLHMYNVLGQDITMLIERKNGKTKVPKINGQ